MSLITPCVTPPTPMCPSSPRRDSTGLFSTTAMEMTSARCGTLRRLPFDFPHHLTPPFFKSPASTSPRLWRPRPSSIIASQTFTRITAAMFSPMTRANFWEPLFHPLSSVTVTPLAPGLTLPSPVLPPPWPTIHADWLPTASSTVRRSFRSPARPFLRLSFPLLSFPCRFLLPTLCLGW